MCHREHCCGCFRMDHGNRVDVIATGVSLPLWLSGGGP